MRVNEDRLRNQEQARPFHQSRGLRERKTHRQPQGLPDAQIAQQDRLADGTACLDCIALTDGLPLLSQDSKAVRLRNHDRSRGATYPDVTTFDSDSPVWAGLLDRRDCVTDNIRTSLTSRPFPPMEATMCRAMLCLILSVVMLSMTVPVQADPHGHTYPKVRTFSGGYYGPTQAHSQYQRRYGRPWHGQNGLHGSHAHGGHGSHSGHGHHTSYGYRHGFGATIGGWAFPSFGFSTYVSPFGLGVTGYGGYPSSYGYWSGYGYPSAWSGYYATPPPAYGNLTSPTAPTFLSPPAPGNPVLNDAWRENQQQWEQPLDALPIIANKRPSLPPSSPAAQGRSIRHQHHGDLLLQNLEYLQASQRYRDAIAAAADRAEPHLHLAIAFAGIRHFDKAVHELKVGLSLDPTWPESGTSLDRLLRPENTIGKMQLKQAIAEWTLEDVRDPDRLFLLGAVLFLDNDVEKARQILETAARLSGMQEYLAIFLRGGNGVVPAGAQVPASTDAQPPSSPTPAEDVRTVQPELPPLPVLPPLNELLPNVPDDASVSTPEVNGPAFPE